MSLEYELDLLEQNEGPVSVPDGALQKAVCESREDLLDYLLMHCTEDQINSLDKQGFAALHYAVKYESVSMIRKLIVKCDCRIRTNDGFTPLQIAACCSPRGTGMCPDTETGDATDAESTGHQVIQILLDGKSAQEQKEMLEDRNWKPHIGTPLHVACFRANQLAVQELLKHIQKVNAELVDGEDCQSTTPLNEACIRGNLPLVKELLKHGANANAKDPVGMRPLQTACTMGYVPVVKAILDYNHKSNHQTAKKMVEAPITWSKNTVMHLVADNGDLEMMMVLLEYGANPSVQNDDGVAPIHIAASQGHINIAEKLLDSGKNLPDHQCRSPLHYAAMRNQVDMINFLISMGCNKEPLDEDSVSPLLLSVKSGKVEAVLALISAGCDVNTKDMDGKSVVFWAAQEGCFEVLEVLLRDERAKLLIRVPEIKHLNTPFHIAAEKGCVQVIELLTTHLGEQLDQHLVHQLDFRNDEHRAPLHLATMRGNMEVVRFLVHKYPSSLTHVDIYLNTPLHLAVQHGRTEVASFLIHEGASVDAKGWKDYTPLHMAARYGHDEMASLLVKADASLEAKDKIRRTPLHWAADGGHAEVISLLIDAGAQLEAKDRDNRTPLHWAAERGHAEIIPLLNDASAQLEAKDKEGATPLFLACFWGNVAAAKELVKRGANVTAQNEKKLNCLDIAVDRGHENMALAIIHTNQWKTDLSDTGGQMTPFKKMIRHMPSAAEAVLDRCIDSNAKHSQDPSKVDLDYRLLDDFHWKLKVADKDHPLALMVKYERYNLLRHPVVTSLLENKWRKYGGILFLINLITYLLFLLFVTMYALLLPHPDQAFCHDFSVTQSISSLPVNGTVCPFESGVVNNSNVLKSDPTVPINYHANIALYFAAVMVILTTVARLLVVECYQLVMTHYRYFQNIENYVEVLAYISSLIFVSHFGTNCWCPTSWQWQLGATGVFLAWFNLILFLKRVPLLGIYILMFYRILHTFLKFALIAVLFVMAFGIPFYMILYKALDDATLLANVSPFRNAGLSFIKTMVMATGELEYDSIFGHSNESSSLLSSFPVVAYILWIIFLIVMPILLTNLLVGLAVGDIKAIQDEAELRSNLLQIEADKLLSPILHCGIIKRFYNMDGETQKSFHPHQGLRHRWSKILEKVWDAERWDTPENIRQCNKRYEEWKNMIKVQTKSDGVSREIKKLHGKLTELMEKNNRMEQLLEKCLVQKQGME